MRRLLLCVYCLMAVSFLYSREPGATENPVIYRLGIDRGLSNNSVRCIYQDHNGFMWFGTYDGLNRYDGSSFKIFRNKLNDSTSLPHNYIYSIGEDANNNLWVGTGQGLCFFSNLTDKFSPAYYLERSTGKRRKITFNVSNVVADLNNNLVISTAGEGLLLQEARQNAAVKIPINKQGKLQYQYTSILTKDHKGNIWVFVPDFGLCLFSPATKKMQLLMTNISGVHAIRADTIGNLWIATASGLYQYNIAGRSVSYQYTSAKNELTSDNIMTLAIDSENNIWAGTEISGINIVNPATRTVKHLLPGEGRDELSSESIMSIYEDRERRQWIGTAKGGINIIDRQKKLFQPVTHDPNNRNSLINNFASSFCEDGKDKLWIGTDGGGVSIWNRQTNKYSNYKHEPVNSASLSHNAVTSIKKDYLGNIWISTYGGGINKYNPASNSFSHYVCSNPVTGRENVNVWALYEDRDKNFWATTFSSGKLYLLNRSLDKFEVFDQGLYDLISIYEDSGGALWVGNSHELIRINKKDRSFVEFEIGKPVRDIFEDSKGRFWLGTEGGGLLLFDRRSGTIKKRFSDADGLCNNSVLKILEDRAGNLWLSTFNGLARFDFNKNSFKNFYQSDGLQSNQFLYSSALKLRSGELVFGGVKGMNLFDPDSLSGRSFMPPVLLTGILINNNPLTLDRHLSVETSNQLFTKVTVPYNEAVFSFEFAALEYSSPSKINYAYMLEGWDKSWNYTNAVRTANYTNLPEGSYTLRIKSTNVEGTWNNKEAQLKIVVLPPWYRSWWAYSIYLLMTVAAVYAYQQYKNKRTRLEYEVRIAKLNADNERAEKQKSQAELQTAKAEQDRQAAALALSKAEQERSTAELEKQKVIYEAEKEINEKRLSFFTSISHEFKTPLTLIINPVKELLDQFKQNKEASNPVEAELNIVYRNARRMLNLINQLLLFRKAEADFNLPNRTNVGIFHLVQDVYLYFSQQAKSKAIDYEFDCPDKNIVCSVDRDKLEVILYNLLSNAFKYTPDHGRILLSVRFSAGQLNIKVSDNGTGIDPSIGDKLFERFYQAANAKTGFGIGLYVVKQFANAHDGDITYESEPGKGTSFFVTIAAPEVEQKEYLPQDNPAELSLLAVPENEEQVRQEAAVEEISTSPMVSGQKIILLIDDNEEIRKYLRHIFETMFKVYEAGSGEEGLKLAHLHQPDIIISDVVMQGINGIDLCKTIKDDSGLGHIPVILLTGNESAESRLKGVEGGADDYITKPFEKDLLVARVQNLLNRRTSLQKYFYNEVTLQQNTLRISQEYKEFIDRCIEIVEDHIEDDQFSIKTLAYELRMSYSKMNKKIKAISGQPANAFIRFIRLRKAAELFINANHNVSETAFMVGMKDVRYFREQFFKLFGMNPSEYIEKYRKSFGNNYSLNEKLIK
ncbi:two-component regulator propeller domain-containing protein [Filimonas effusa]|uniref:histidine kinase n=1 Tax=Filimonas effusa TaxID=2508721 RepID=A0A4Q1D9F9_9BACT|nr:two-component regulator propeller domain-containing protein [Filimonas effusa]RXK86014.1 response regulator [Filimonas effusa]